MANQAQRTFAGGEIAPSFYAHTDLAKYGQSLRRCRNFFVQANGGVANRPGLEFIGPLLQPLLPGRLIPWVFNDEQSYVLELTDHQIRIIHDGEYLSAVSAPAWNALTTYTPGDVVLGTGGFYYNYVAADPNLLLNPGVGTEWQSRWKIMDAAELQFPSPWAYTDLPKLRWVQSADVMTLTCEGYPVYELRRLGALKWVLVPTTFGPLIQTPTQNALSGGVAGDDTWYAVTAVSAENAEESIPSVLKIASIVPDATTAVHVSWSPVSGALEYNIYRSVDGTTFGLIAVVGGTPTSYIDTTWAGSPDTATAATPNVLAVSGTQARNATVTVAGEKASDTKYRITGSHLLVQSSGGASLQTTGRVKIYAKRDTDAARVLVYTTPDLVLNGDGGNYGPIDATVEIEDDGYATLAFDLVPEVISDVIGATDQVTGTDVRYTRAQLSYDDLNIDPDYTQAPPTNPKLFDTVATYPAVVGQAQQRRFFANTPTQPEMAWGSRTALPANFSISTPLEDSDAISWRLAGRKVNEVRHLVELGALLQFTSGGVFVVEGDQAGILKPDAVNPRRISAHGSNDLSPVDIGEAALLYVQARGVKVRVLTQGSQGDFGGQDLTLLAAHLFKGHTIVDWAYCEEPDSILWCVRDDGVLIGLTFLAEQEIYGWHRHDTLGTVESVCAVPEGARDALYCIVKRPINGSDKRYVERLSPRTILDVTDAIFMDAAISFDGRHTGAASLSARHEIIGADTVQYLETSSPYFTAGDVGTEIRFTVGGVAQAFTITAFHTTQQVEGEYASTYDPGAVSVVIGTTWTHAVTVIGGLGHLEGATVAVLGDGYVDGSPNNADYPAIVVTGGEITLPSPRAVVHIGLPYLSDLETLDIDTASGPSMKETAMLINEVGMYVEETRGGFYGGAPPTDDTVDPLEGLYEIKERAGEPYDSPVALRTGDRAVKIDNRWTKHGRVFVRQVDPLPIAVLAIWPSGYLPR